MRDTYEICADQLEKGDQQGLFKSIEAMCYALVGVRLFTCMTFNREAGLARRIYTNDADAYPVHGEKTVEPNRWTEQVLEQHRPFLATSIDEIRDVFPDHERIESLGVGATINLPIILGGEVLGTLNLLDKNGRYSAASIEALSPVRLPAIAAFCWVKG